MIPRGKDSQTERGKVVRIALPLRDMDGILSRFNMIFKDMENMTLKDMENITF